ncbi:3-oxoacyl-(acyl-carrier-protein) reductase FabG [Rhodospirillaceae bacterium LM-1]|nr:3-oxoacyl-(acyl-carrier-protein) reductase FabG [Rhodospirillaceae bacterium LM-1]
MPSESMSTPDRRPLLGLVAVVTGASRGIGAATASCLAARGANVVLTCQHNEDALVNSAVALEAAHGISALAIVADNADESQVATVYRAVHSKFKRLDILVNNAGILGDAMIGMITQSMLDRVFAVNLSGAINNMQLAARLMRRNGRGAIINVSSIMGIRGNPGQVTYCASKAGLIGATLSAAKELAPHGIRVNAVAPGYIDTDLICGLDPVLHAQRIASICVGRPGSAEEVARAIVFLASDEASYITGQVLGVDGGMVI